MRPLPFLGDRWAINRAGQVLHYRAPKQSGRRSAQGKWIAVPSLTWDEVSKFGGYRFWPAWPLLPVSAWPKVPLMGTFSSASTYPGLLDSVGDPATWWYFLRDGKRHAMFHGPSTAAWIFSRDS